MFAEDKAEWVYKNANRGGFAASGGYQAIGQLAGVVGGALLANRQAKKQRDVEKEIAEKQLQLQKELGLAQIKASGELEKQRLLTQSLYGNKQTTTTLKTTTVQGRTVLFVVVGLVVVGAIGFAVYKMKNK